MRLFVALSPPVAVREALADWASGVLGDSAELRPVRVEAMHLTLAFLGERPRDEC